MLNDYDYLYPHTSSTDHIIEDGNTANTVELVCIANVQLLNAVE